MWELVTIQLSSYGLESFRKWLKSLGPCTPSGKFGKRTCLLSYQIGLSLVIVFCKWSSSSYFFFFLFFRGRYLWQTCFKVLIVTHHPLGNTFQDLNEGWTFGVMMRCHLDLQTPYQNSWLESCSRFWFQSPWLGYSPCLYSHLQSIFM